MQKPAMQPRKSIFGEWQLNREDSDNPQQKMEEARSSQRNAGYGGGGPRVGFPGGGMGGGGLGGRRMGQRAESDEERQKMQELMNPASRLTIMQPLDQPEPLVAGTNEGPMTVTEVDISDDQQRKLTLFTDGRKVQKSKDPTKQEIAAHWDGKRLVTDEKGPRGNKMSRTYELSYDGTQLYETLHLTLGRSESPLFIRYAYDASGQPPAAANETAPPAAASSNNAPKQ